MASCVLFFRRKDTVFYTILRKREKSNAFRPSREKFLRADQIVRRVDADGVERRFDDLDADAVLQRAELFEFFAAFEGIGFTV